MKRIVLLLVCAMLFAMSSSAEARWFRRSNQTYTQSTVRPTAAVQPVSTATAKPAQVTTANYSPSPAQPVRATTASYSTSTAQGVANIMASTGRVGHWGGNPGYEGCGAGASAAAAYNNCCYANSGMRTVDVGYARSASGMWFCCRRYR